jgi:hypothetical protein
MRIEVLKPGNLAAVNDTAARQACCPYLVECTPTDPPLERLPGEIIPLPTILPLPED